MEIKQIEAGHYPEIVTMYLQGIATGIATFQTEATDCDTWDKSHLAEWRLAACEADKMVGWAARLPASGRRVYARVAEVSIYIAAAFRGKGIEKSLLLKLIEESEAEGLWTLQSGIFTENTRKIKLHEQCGFRKIGNKLPLVNARIYAVRN